MPKADFVPAKEADLINVEKLILEKVDTVAQTLNLPAEAVATVKSKLNLHQTAYTEKLNSEKAYKASIEKDKDAQYEAVSGKGGLRELANLVKSQPGYTTEIGASLGIEGAVTSINYAELKPVLKTSFEGLNIVIKFSKQGTNGIKLFSKRGEEPAFTFLAIDTASPYTDSREKINSSLPELREYQAIYIVKDEPVGQMSDIVRVTVP